jgi:HK97 family phage portal protein
MKIFNRGSKRREELEELRHLIDTQEKASQLVGTDVDGEAPVPIPETYTDFEEAYSVESWVYIAVNKVSKAVAGLPLKLYEKNLETGERKEVHDNATGNIWCNKPNEFQPKFLFWWAITAYLLLTGNAFIERVRKSKTDEDSEVLEVYPLNPKDVDIIPDKHKFIRGYKYKKRKKIITPKKIKHLQLFSPQNDYRGASPMGAATVATTLDLYAQAHSQQFFKQGARPSIVLSTDQHLKPGDIRVMKSQIRAQYQGSKKAWLPLVLYNGLKAYEFSLTNKDTEFVDQRKLSREEICAVFEVPPSIAGIYEYANYANSFAQKEIFYRECIRPICQLLEDYLNFEIENENIEARKKGIELYFEFKLDDVLKADTKTRYEAYTKAIELGFLTINEARKLENMESVEWGEVWHMPRNKWPVDRLDELAETQDDKNLPKGENNSNEEEGEED